MVHHTRPYREFVRQFMLHTKSSESHSNTEVGMLLPVIIVIVLYSVYQRLHHDQWKCPVNELVENVVMFDPILFNTWKDYLAQVCGWEDSMWSFFIDTLYIIVGFKNDSWYLFLLQFYFGIIGSIGFRVFVPFVATFFAILSIAFYLIEKICPKNWIGNVMVYIFSGVNFVFQSVIMNCCEFISSAPLVHLLLQGNHDYKFLIFTTTERKSLYQKYEDTIIHFKTSLNGLITTCLFFAFFIRLLFLTLSDLSLYREGNLSETENELIGGDYAVWYVAEACTSHLNSTYDYFGAELLATIPASLLFTPIFMLSSAVNFYIKKKNVENTSATLQNDAASLMEEYSTSESDGESTNESQ